MTYLPSTASMLKKAGIDLENTAQVDWINPHVDDACDLIDEIEIMINEYAQQQTPEEEAGIEAK